MRYAGISRRDIVAASPHSACILRGGGYNALRGRLAQLAEQGTLNPKVIGSIPISPTIAHMQAEEHDFLGLICYIGKSLCERLCAGVAELADALGLGPSGATCGGSNPLARTTV